MSEDDAVMTAETRVDEAAEPVADVTDETGAAEGDESDTGEFDTGAEGEIDTEITDDELGSALEALLLVVDTPTSVDSLSTALDEPVDRVGDKLRRMASEFAERGSGIDLREAGGGWRMYTRARYAPYVERLILDGARSKLTRAALETLAVVAYRQPVTRARVSAVRGVNVDAVIRTLAARGLIIEAGNDSDSGATTFATTELFLERLGLTSLAELPDIAPLLPDVDVIDDIAETLSEEPRFAKLGGAHTTSAVAGSAKFDVDRD
ncbi:segregation and condensation protein B [Mycobacterium sp. MAA66]|uniref:SMC-Scp complex subunit ScpB n=1 Tax=Mycobacterium sp. MAA66 TaxID=3156297 RepID=UPI0035174FE1